MYGLQRPGSATAEGPGVQDGYSRHPDRHCSGGHTIEDILDKLFACLRLRSRLAERHQLRDDSLEKSQKLGRTLNRVGNL